MFKLIICLIFMFVGSKCAKILGVFPLPSISHQVVFRPVMHELADRGHEVTVITTDPAFLRDQVPPNLTEIDVHDISYKHWNKLITDAANIKNPLRFVEFLRDSFSEIFERQMESNEIQIFLLANKKFDLIFIESSVRPALIFSHIFKAPVIEFCSGSAVFSAYDRVGAATHPLIYPDVFHRRIYNLTLWEKITEVYNHYWSESMYAQYVHVENEKLKAIFGSDIPDLDYLKRNVQMLFLNVHPIWDINRPVPPNLVYLGGLHLKPEKDLPKDLKSYLDFSENGVIYISFGTNVKTSWFTPERLKIFTEVFSQLPYDVLWKWDNDELPGRPRNVRISKWLPQSDLLRHPKVKLFITQGGLQSTDEAITSGVPLIGIPMLGDQWFNVEQYVKFNIGKRLSIETLTEEQLMDAIKTVIHDDSYRQNIAQLRDIMHDQPQPPLERAVWWTEHVLRHGAGAHYRAPGAGVSWTEYYEIEIISLVLVALVLLLVATLLTIYCVVSKIKHFMTLKIKVN